MGCDTATQYCLITETTGLGAGCCRTKGGSGDKCLPVDEGVDCQSGKCNNFLKPLELFGIVWNFGFFNLFLVDAYYV